ncbi:hypothetical protein CLAFUW4_09813 [Fulvia fulva]|uniref:Uncharacterized protein n=1 Tax=Passalora fulva TaxID=5499 RepID=A0A9Q8PI98_PASFU|nr:uncharacterized protein CLAFUR5_12425 [Fulvia fulva]KAK4615700.1 hypothetical protein CLAFUR4_09819 [Fulvia fulva]KAK4616726.1 hypothetical protein CLAFUR0_09812 [Fulvia fulva]UJO22980.1 hypothetical protein CLAFUR5_12425 [Fulvia fulva]WPV18842.1 hypothetical protein CLAFUW4_09813 [Fulvia fulva]WPV33872.1 hypothetical protein CLAFUW7_09816 [Fulvia fulva]
MKQAHYEQANVRGFPPKPKGELVVLRGSNEGIYLENRKLEGALVPSSSRRAAALPERNSRLDQSYDNEDGDDDDESNDDGDNDDDEPGEDEENSDTRTSRLWNGY